MNFNSSCQDVFDFYKDFDKQWSRLKDMLDLNAQWNI